MGQCGGPLVDVTRSRSRLVGSFASDCGRRAGQVGRLNSRGLFHAGERQAGKRFPRKLEEGVQWSRFVGPPFPRSPPNRRAQHAPRARLREGGHGSRGLEDNFCVSSLRHRRQSRYCRRHEHARKESGRTEATIRGSSRHSNRKRTGGDERFLTSNSLSTRNAGEFPGKRGSNITFTSRWGLARNFPESAPRDQESL